MREPQVEWREEYATGVEQVYQDHRMIFQMSGDFRRALDDGLGDEVYPVFLDDLKRYCGGHFGFEEECMTAHRCPVARENKAAHEKFLSTLAGFQRRYDAHGYSDSDARRLVDTMDQWLDSHICNIDIHLRRCVSK